MAGERWRGAYDLSENVQYESGDMSRTVGRRLGRLAMLRVINGISRVAA
jgi:hypothetical protein